MPSAVLTPPALYWVYWRDHEGAASKLNTGIWLKLSSRLVESVRTLTGLSIAQALTHRAFEDTLENAIPFRHWITLDNRKTSIMEPLFVGLRWQRRPPNLPEDMNV